MSDDFYHYRAHTTPYYFWLGSEAEEVWYEELLIEESERMAENVRRGVYQINYRS